ncbi:thioredoxin [Enterococcus italicus DSM 15952]|jgi:thioredoxin 1|uniref:Thioredoxin n=2 Tax=Enterococcus italicus TaxID=246144 RepID=E6LH55_ENTI1|nr:thioredoxin [Enterococcus italicus DSM 15952]OJG61839.1 thioredoxin [Enterococcus italicus DSM 15952]HCS30626.1 thioredoxin [Enterococcus sp.]
MEELIMPTNITDATFTEETDKGLVLIDFWAPWCGPCRMQAPILEQLANEFDEEELKIVKMDVDENPETPASFGIMSIPTLVLKKDGQMVEKVVGVHTKDQLEELVKSYQ